MRKLLSISLLVLVMTLLVVSCSPENKTLDDGLALISFSTDGGGDRSLTKTDPKLDPDDFYWYYTATKTDGTGLVTGWTDSQTPVIKPVDNESGNTGKGLNNSVGPFSYGEWVFTLYAYAETRPTFDNGKVTKGNLAYSGKSTITIDAPSGNSLTVVVASKQTAGVKGTLLFPLKNAMIEKTKTDAGVATDVSYDKFLEEITITRVDGKDSFLFAEETVSKSTGDSAPCKKLYEYSTSKSVNEETVRYVSLESGSYKVTFKYIQSATKTYSGQSNTEISGYTGGYTVAEETIYIAVADYLTTTIGGEITSNTGKVDITVENGKTEITVKDVEIKSDTATTFTGKKDNDDSNPVVEVIVPANALSGSSATMVSEVLSPEVASESNAEYLFKDKSGAVIGGGSTAIYVDGSSEETKTFGFKNNNAVGSSSNKAVRTIATITLPTNLNNGKFYKNSSCTGVSDTTKYPMSTESTKNVTDSDGSGCDISSGYSGDKTGYTTDKGYDIPDGMVVYYNPETGLTAYEVEHFSTYFFASDSAVFYDAKENKAYKDLDSALTGVGDGGTITLLKDVSLSAGTIKLNKTVTIDLNGKTMTLGNFASWNNENTAFYLIAQDNAYTVTVQNGTIKTAGSTRTNINNVFVVGNNAVLNLNRITMDTNALTGVYFEVEACPGTVSISKSELKGLYEYGVGTNASKDDKTFANLTITDSKVIVKSNSYDNAGILVNIPSKIVIEGSEISGDRQGLILRGTGENTAEIKNTKISATGKGTVNTGDSGNKGSCNYKDRSTTWEGGNEVALAAVVIGNSKSTAGSYKNPTFVDFDSVEIVTEDGYNGKKIWITQASGNFPVVVTGFNETSWTAFNDDFNGAAVRTTDNTWLVNNGETLKFTLAVVDNKETVKFLKNVTCVLNDEGSLDTTCDRSLWFGGDDITVDFNNKKLVIKSNYGGCYNTINAFGAGCTFKNGEIFVYRKCNDKDSKGICQGKKVENKSYGYDADYPDWDSYAIAVETEGDCTISGMTLHGGISFYGKVNATIENTTYVYATNYYSVYQEGYDANTTTIKSGTFSGSDGNPVFYNAHSGDSIIIEGGTYTGTLFNGTVGKMTITGGTFKDGSIVPAGSEKAAKDHIEIKGGTFSSDPSKVAYTKDGTTEYFSYVAEGYEAKQNTGDNTYTVSQTQAQ